MKNFTFLYTCVMLFLVIGQANAADYYWKSTGRADQNYTNVANWESAPGSGLPANGSLAPSSVDNVYFPAGNTVQTITIGSGAASANFNILSSGVITLNGVLSVYGSFTSNGNHLFASGMTFLGAGNHTINMGDGLSHTSLITAGDFTFSGTGTYTLLSDLNLPRKSIRISNSTFVANGFWIQVAHFGVLATITGSKTINLANSKLSLTQGASYGGEGTGGTLFFNAPPATTAYEWTNVEIYINQNSNISHINISGSETTGTIINGIKSITFTETAPGVSAWQIRSSSVGNFTFNVTDFYMDVSAFHFRGSTTNLNIGNLHILRPVDITTDGTVSIAANTIDEPVSCLGQSSMRSEAINRISFNAVSPITTSNIGFKNINFTGSTVSMPSNNDLGLNIGNYTTTAGPAPNSFYWVGGAGSWNDPEKWSVTGSGGAPQSASGCLPGFNDDVYFDANSFTASGQTVTIVGNGKSVGYARNVNWTDPGIRGRLTLGELNINGSADFSGSISVSSRLVYLGSGDHTVKSGSTVYSSASIQFLGTGTYTLSDDLKAGTAIFQIGSGSFKSAGKSITAFRFESTSVPAQAGNVRNIDFTNSVLTLLFAGGGGENTFVLNTVFLESFNVGGSVINLTAANSGFYISGYTSNGSVTLNTLSFNDINFTALTGTSIFSHFGVFDFKVNNVNFKSNGSILQQNIPGATHAVNSYNFSPGKSYTFNTTANAVFTVINGINTNSTGSCAPKVSISGSNNVRAKIYKATLPFDVVNAILKDINATGVTMSSPGGEDLGNNINVNITANPSQNFYWVGGAGNWNDASHWSIGVSGGDPALTNAASCIPALSDDVFFDGNSFTAAGQTVTIDNNAFCRNMLWDSAVSSRSPVLAGANGNNLNTYGSVTLAPNMTAPFLGTWNMRGTSQAANANFFKTNGVVIASLLLFNGGGRYDLADNFSSTGVVRHVSGQFYTNSRIMTARAMNLTVTGTNIVDISNSVITLTGSDGSVNTYVGLHSASAGWNATGSTINANFRSVGINVPAGAVINYGTLNVNQTGTVSGLSNSGPGILRFTDISFLSSINSISGRIVTDNLSYLTSSDNTVGGGSLITVNNSLTASGTPCNPIRFRSGTAGTPATLISGSCNFDIKFARLTDIAAGTGCAAAQNRVVGDDAGGNSNWTFASISGFEYLGADKILGCAQYPYTLSTASFNADATSYFWSTGATTPDIIVTGPGTYSVTVSYGVGCNLTDSITLGLAANPILNDAVLNACAALSGGSEATFDLTDANAILVAVPSDYTFTYHNSAAEATTDSNEIGTSYTGAGKTVYVRAVETATGCFSTKAVVLTVQQKVSPTVNAQQRFCSGTDTTLADIIIAGVDVKWYADLSSTAELPAGTLLVNGATYYATQTVAAGCESERVSVTVSIESCASINPSLRMRVSQ